MSKNGLLILYALLAIGGLVALIAGAVTGNVATIVTGAIVFIAAAGFFLHALWERNLLGPRRRRAVT